ncbi:hypothetical protein F0L68_28455 [Solihabitans fulvus]|uniref:Uncharacterized protein n=1 Tax=Solihabitans fulvus TaxID=1892852 RepID=A0A5B2WX84_9PSEU|nr:hypothetical protein [Solihabitans fulvus]KAA2255490.1 hypothetical protein F0L68_28455 [Solihabitans fulvus]
MRSARRFGLIGAALVVGLFAGGGVAMATNPNGVASLGSASFTKGAQAPVSVASLAPCDVDGQQTNSSAAVVKPGVTFGGGTSSCTRTVTDPENDVTTTRSTATGKNFELSVLLSAGGPRIKLASYTVTCNATQTGTNAGWSFSGMSGISGLPQQIPNNYVAHVKKTNGTVLADVTVNEVMLPDPNDGSIALNLMHFHFLPASGISGELVIGATACAPTP